MLFPHNLYSGAKGLVGSLFSDHTNTIIVLIGYIIGYIKKIFWENYMKKFIKPILI